MYKGHRRHGNLASNTREHCTYVCRLMIGEGGRGTVNVMLLVGVFLFVISYSVVLWFHFSAEQLDSSELAENSSHLDMPEPRDQIDKSNTESGPSNDKPRQLANVREPLTEEKSISHIAGMVAEPDILQNEPEQARQEKPLDDLTIAGRVLTRSGSPVTGIEVTATATHLFEQGRRKAISPDARQRRATSGYDGSYVFENLANGEYQVSTTATEQYARVLIQARAGVDFADLIVTGHRDLRVHGIITTAGEPLARVRVRAVIYGSREVTTNKEGRYTFDVKLLDNMPILTVRASREGYQNQEVRLDSTRPDASNGLELNIVMVPDSDAALAEVAGTLRGPKGDPVAGQRIQFSSAKVRQSYQATTNTDGRFLIRLVEPGDDYMLSINAAGNYKDYFQRSIEISHQNLALNIKLEAMDIGVLSGEMVNLLGNPVPNFSLVLMAKETPYYQQQVISNEMGNFVIEQAPAGELYLKTNSTPYYIIKGIWLASGAELHVPIVLDWGYDEIRGQTVNDQGYPVAVTNIHLSWAFEQNGIRGTSRRITAADEQGNFRFTQIGPGSHLLTFNSEFYKPVSVNHDVAIHGSELVVKLEAK